MSSVNDPTIEKLRFRLFVKELWTGQLKLLHFLLAADWEDWPFLEGFGLAVARINAGLIVEVRVDLGVDMPPLLHLLLYRE